MVTSVFNRLVTSREQLREMIGEPSPVAVKKQMTSLDEHCRSFIARSPFLLLATADASGRCDVSPRGDAPGFVRVLDDRTLAIPERPGNRRTDSMTNILENPHVGLIFLIPGVERTLRVNGRAVLSRDEDVLESMAVQGKRPLLAIGVSVEEVYLHCPKAFKRARLWRDDYRVDEREFPTFAQMLMDHARLSDCTVDDLERSLEESNRNLY